MNLCALYRNIFAGRWEYTEIYVTMFGIYVILCALYWNMFAGRWEYTTIYVTMFGIYGNVLTCICNIFLFGVGTRLATVDFVDGDSF